MRKQAVGFLVALVASLAIPAAAMADNIPGYGEFQFRAEQLTEVWCRDDPMPAEKQCVTLDEWDTWWVEKAVKVASGWYRYTATISGAWSIWNFGKRDCEILSHWRKQREITVRWAYNSKERKWEYRHTLGPVRMLRKRYKGPPPIRGYESPHTPRGE